MISPMLTRSRSIPSLDGLRAVSIGLVLLGHLAAQMRLSRATYAHFAHLSNLGVRVFFVISGFLITGLLLKELEAEGTIRLPRFYFRRTLRIVPPYYVFLLVIAALSAWGSITLSSWDLIRASTYTSNYHQTGSWHIGHTWSLAVEEQFYLLWPVVLVYLGRRRGMAICGALVLLCPVLRDHQIGPGVGKTFETIADTLAVGALLAGCRVQLHARQWYREALDSRQLAWLLPLSILGITLFGNGPPWLKLMSGTLVNLAVALLIDRVVTNPRTATGRILNLPALTIVGVMSYSIYLWQQIFLHPSSSRAVAAFPLNLALIAVASLISYYAIERPALGWRERLEKQGVWFRRARPGAGRDVA